MLSPRTTKYALPEHTPHIASKTCVPNANEVDFGLHGSFLLPKGDWEYVCLFVCYLSGNLSKWKASGHVIIDSKKTVPKGTEVDKSITPFV